MIPYDDIYSGLIKLTKDLVGDQLSTQKTSDSTTPSVIRTRTDRPQPDLPYVTINIDNTIEPSGLMTNVYLDEVTGKPVYEKLYESFITWKCYGKGAESILQQVHARLSTQYTRDVLCKMVDGGLSTHVRGDVLSTPDLATTSYVDGATMTISFYVTDTFTDPLNEGDYLKTIEGEGKLVTGVDGDIPVPIYATIP